MSAKDIKDKIFISFSFSVKDTVIALKNKIESEIGEGSCWICTTGIQPGDRMSKTITNAIHNADVMLCMINQGFINSENCEREISLADQLKKRIIDVHLEEMKLPYVKKDGENSALQLLNRTDVLYVSLYKDTINKKEEFDKLISYLKKLFDKERSASDGVQQVPSVASSTEYPFNEAPVSHGGDRNPSYEPGAKQRETYHDKAADKIQPSHTGNTKTPNFKLPHMTREVTEAALAVLSSKLGNSYRQFALQKLKLTKTEIENCVHPNKDSLPDIAFNCLYKWKENTSCQATYGELAKLLYQFGYPKEVWGVLESPPE